MYVESLKLLVYPCCTVTEWGSHTGANYNPFLLSGANDPIYSSFGPLTETNTWSQLPYLVMVQARILIKRLCAENCIFSPQSTDVMQEFLYLNCPTAVRSFFFPIHHFLDTVPRV